MEVLQMLTLFIAPSSIDDVGQQLYHFVLGTMDVESDKVCHENCFFQTVIGRGDLSGVTVYGQHNVAVVARNLRIKKNEMIVDEKIINQKIKHLWLIKLKNIFFQLLKT